MARTRRESSTWEPVPHAFDEHPTAGSAVPPVAGSHRVVRIGRLRVPLAGAYRPWATLYRLPDGRELWCLRLWEGGRPVRRAVSNATLISYARRSRLRRLEAQILELRGRVA
jgi:hypothetical protein